MSETENNPNESRLAEVNESFQSAIVPGSVKKAMAAVGASSRDLWQVELADIHVFPGFNVRVKDDAYLDHVRNLAHSILTNGFYQDKPLAGFVVKEGDDQKIFVHDGHCRLEATRIAIEQGAQIERLPVVIAPAGTSLDDLTIGLIQSNSGRPLSPFEVAVVCKRLVGYGWEHGQIASRVGITETYLDGLLQIMAAPMAIRQMIQDGRVSVATALDALRRYGADAVEKLQVAEASAKAAGKTRVTATHLPGKKFESYVKRTGPKLYDAAQIVVKDPGFKRLNAATQDLLTCLLDELAQAKAKTENAENIGEGNGAEKGGEE